MIQDANWTFAEAEGMPNDAEDELSGVGDYDGYIDWTASKWKDWINTPMPLWLVVTCNTVPSGGTSIQVEFYQHSTTTLHSGDMLLAGRVIALADLSASADDPGHWLFCVPLMSCLCSVQAADRDQYCGLVLKGTGDVSTGKVDAWVHIGANPPIPVARPTASNIVMPTT